MSAPRRERSAPVGADAMRGTSGRAPSLAAPRGVRSPHRGYDPAALPTRPAVLRASVGGAIAHDIPGSRAFVGRDIARLDSGVAFDGCRAVRGEHGMLLTDRGSESRTRARRSGASAGEIER
jgi:hypothetical protein